MSEFHTLTLSEVIKETPNSVVLTFDVPEPLVKNYEFISGQYLTIKHEIDGKEIRRAYSICSTPKSKKLQVGIKKVQDGAFSVFAHSQLKAGDSLNVMIPDGKFMLQPQADVTKNYAAFVAGSGITPVISMIETILKEEPNSTFLLAYGNTSVSETMFHARLQQLMLDFPTRLNIEFLYSRERQEGVRFGRIDRSLVNLFLKNKFESTVFDAFYLCGPEPMIDEVSSALKENGINEKIIHFELFTTAEIGLLVESHDGTTELTVTVDDETATFTMEQGKSVLEATLANDMDAPYSCQGGICSTCIARIKEGKAEMSKNQILTDGEIAEGLILTCQAHPTTPTLVIDYDDV